MWLAESDPSCMITGKRESGVVQGLRFATTWPPQSTAFVVYCQKFSYTIRTTTYKNKGE